MSSLTLRRVRKSYPKSVLFPSRQTPLYFLSFAEPRPASLDPSLLFPGAQNTFPNQRKENPHTQESASGTFLPLFRTPTHNPQTHNRTAADAQSIAGLRLIVLEETS